MTRDETIALAKSSGLRLESWMTNPPTPAAWWATPEALLEFAKRIRADERERCAKAAEQYAQRHDEPTCAAIEFFAGDIRSMKP